jgi:hypothetical protein
MIGYLSFTKILKSYRSYVRIYVNFSFSDNNFAYVRRSLS